MVIMKRQELGTGFKESMYTIPRRVNQFHPLIVELDRSLIKLKTLDKQ